MIKHVYCCIEKKCPKFFITKIAEYNVMVKLLNIALLMFMSECNHPKIQGIQIYKYKNTKI